MTNNTVGCALLVIPGYKHTDKYRERWEGRSDEWRLVTGTRWIIPVLLGHVVTNGQRERAIIALSFTPNNPNRQTESLQNIINFLKEPDKYDPRRLRWRTLVISRIPDAKRISAFTVTLSPDFARRFVEWAYNHLVGTPPTNFEPDPEGNLLSHLFKPPRELLKMLAQEGIVPEDSADVTDDTPPDEEDDWPDSGEDWDNMAEDDEWEYSPQHASKGDMLPEEAPEQDWETEEPRFAAPSSTLPPSPGLVEPETQEESETPKPQQPDTPRNEDLELLLRNYRPNPMVQQMYQPRAELPKEDLWGEFEFLRRYKFTLFMVAIEAGIGLLSLLFPPISLAMLVLIGGRGGLRMIIGGLILSLLLPAARMGIVPLKQFYWVYIIFVLVSLILYTSGIKMLYRRYNLNFELSRVSRSVKQVVKRILPSPKVASPEGEVVGVPGLSGGASLGSINAFGDIKGAIPDLLFVLSLVLFLYPPLIPVGVALVLLCWHLERRLISLWNLGSLIVLLFRYVDWGNREILWSIIAGLITYITVRSDHDITKQVVQQWPEEIRQFFSLFVRYPIAALKIVWSGKGALPPQPLKAKQPRNDAIAHQTLASLPVVDRARLLGYLSPRQKDAWAELARQERLIAPISLVAQQSHSFYYLVYGLRTVEFDGDEPLSPEIRQAMQTDARVMLTRLTGEVPDSGGFAIPSVCRISPDDNAHCIHNPYRRAVVAKDGVLIPVGTSYVIYLSSDSHQHYASSLFFSPSVSGHAIIAAASGSGKSVLVRGIAVGAAEASTVFPIRVLYAEGKTESSSAHRYTPFIAPIGFLKDSKDVLSYLSAIRAIMLTRQKVREALSRHLKKDWNIADLFQERYGGLPYLICILDEFWAARMATKGQTVSAEVNKGGKTTTVRVQAEKVFVQAMDTILTQARSQGIGLIVTTQSTKAEIITPGIRSNASPLLGGLSNMQPQLVSNLVPNPDLVAMRALASRLSGRPETYLGLRYSFFAATPQGVPIYWVRHDGSYVRNGDTSYSGTPPTWDVFLPYYHTRFATIDDAQLKQIDTERFLADLREALRDPNIQEMMGPEPKCGWLRAIGWEPFASFDDVLAFGRASLQTMIATSIVSFDDEEEEQEQ